MKWQLAVVGGQEINFFLKKGEPIVYLYPMRLNLLDRTLECYSLILDAKPLHTLSNKWDKSSQLCYRERKTFVSIKHND